MRRTISIVAFATLLAACGSGESSETTVGTAPPTTAGGNADSVVLTVTSEGGFVPVEFNLDRLPRFQLMSDGRLFSVGPVPAIFPGPMLTNVQVTMVDDDLRGEIDALIEELGLADIDERIDDSGAEMIADATTEFITYHDESGTHRLGIYALGLTEGVPASSDRILATELVEILDEAAATGEATTYIPEQLQVAAGPGMEEPGMSTEQPWPLNMDFEDMADWGVGWRCTAVSGDAVAPLLEIFGEANQATLWGPDRLGIRARPLLPGETACGGAPAG